MAARLVAISDRAAALAQRQPRLAVGGSMLGCIVLAEFLAALFLRGGVS